MAPDAGLSLCHFCFSSCYIPLLAGRTPARSGRILPPTVLVVEDDPSVRLLLTLALKGEGFAVANASNGAEALTRVYEQWPQAIVLDLWMPVMNGPSFLEELRQTSPGQSIPVVAISAHGRRQTAKQLGVEALLPKPFDLHALIGTVTELVAASA